MRVQCSVHQARMLDVFKLKPMTAISIRPSHLSTIETSTMVIVSLTSFTLDKGTRLVKLGSTFCRWISSFAKVVCVTWSKKEQKSKKGKSSRNVRLEPWKL